MYIRSSILLSPILLLLLVASHMPCEGGFVIPEQQGCTPLGAERVIRNSGCYELTEDITVERDVPGILIEGAEDVIIDLEGHTIRGPSPSTGTGIEASGVRRVSITKGKISGFLYGIRVRNNSVGVRSQYVLIENMIVTGASARGILVDADNARIANNMVSNIIGYPPAWTELLPIGIDFRGMQCEIYNNVVRDVSTKKVGEDVPIATTPGCAVGNNTVEHPLFGQTIGFRDMPNIVCWLFAAVRSGRL